MRRCTDNIMTTVVVSFCPYTGAIRFFFSFSPPPPPRYNVRIIYGEQRLRRWIIVGRYGIRNYINLLLLIRGQPFFSPPKITSGPEIKYFLVGRIVKKTERIRHAYVHGRYANNHIKFRFISAVLKTFHSRRPRVAKTNPRTSLPPENQKC